MFPVRYAFAGWLFLKPLGTFPTMRPMGVSVKKFQASKVSFHQPFFLCDSVG